MSDHTDISEAQGDCNGDERAYRTAAGTLAYVSAVAHPHERPGALAVRLEARALDADFEPITDPHGRPITAGPHHLTIHSDQPIDVEAEIERARHLLLDQLDTAVTHSRTLAGLVGVRIDRPTLN